MLRLVACVILGASLSSINNGQMEQGQLTPSIADLTESAESDSAISTTSSAISDGDFLVNLHEKRIGTDGKPIVTVLVIGSGMAGITAARQLADRTDFDVIVLEANSERYGGRLWSYEAPGYSGKPVELGAMWLHGGTDGSHPLSKLVNQFGLGTMEHDVGESDEIEVYDLLGKKYNEENMIEIAKVPHLVSDLRRQTIETNSPDITYENAFKILTMKYPRIFEQNRVRYFEIPGLESYQGSTKDQISLIYSDGIPNGTLAVEYEGHDLIIPSGYRRLLDSLITSGRKFQIELGRQVTKLNYGAAIQVTSLDTKSKEKHIYTADHIVVTVPLGVLKADKIEFTPPLPSDKLRAIERIGFGNMVKVLLVYDKPFWPDVKYFGVESLNPTGLPLFFINLHKIHKLPALLASISSQGAVEADKMSENELIKRVVEHLDIIFGNKTVQSSNLVHTKITRWKNDPLIGGAYSFGKFGMTSDDAFNIRTPIKPQLFFAGEHTTIPESFHGTVHGAHLSGIRVAEEIMTERGIPLKSAAPTVNWLGKMKMAAILSHLILYL